MFGIGLTRRRLLAVAAVLAAAVAVAAAATLPSAGLRWGLVEAMRRLGVVEVAVSDTDLRLFAGRIKIQRLVARPPAGTRMGLDDLALRFRWRPLLDRRLAVDAVALSGLTIEVERTAAGVVVNGLPLAVGADAPADGPPWTFDVESLRLTDSTLAYADGELEARVAIDELAVENLRSWDPAAEVRYRLKGRVNGAAVTVEGTATPFAGHPAFALKLAADRLDLAGLARAAARLGFGALAGRASADLAVRGTLADAQAEGRIALAGLGLEAGGTRVSAASAEWTGRLATEGDGTGRLEVAEAALASAAAEASARTLSLDVKSVGWNGRRLALAGGLAASGVAAKADGAQFAVGAADLTADRLTLEPSPSPRLEWQGTASLAEARLSTPALDASPQRIAWNGRLDADLAHRTGRAEGSIELDQVQAWAGELAITQRRATASGTLEFGHAAAEGWPGVAGTLALAAEGLAVRVPARQEDWLRLERAEAEQLRLAPAGGGSLERLSLTGLAAMQRTGPHAFPWRVEAREAAVDRLALEPGGAVSAATAAVQSLTLRLTRTGNGFLGLAQPARDADAGSAPDAFPRIAVGRIAVGGASRLMFEDRTPPEPVRLDLQPLELSVSELDSARPDHDSPFAFHAQAGEADIRAGGSLRPFAEEFSGEVKGEVKALELPPLSPYAADALGIHLHTGHFDGNLQVAVRRRALNGKVDLVLSNLFVAEPDPEAPLARKIDMPIETVLDLLRDGEDRIRLGIPIGGDLANPNFDVSDAVAQAVGGALKSTALTTLKVMFPVAAIIGMVIDADDRARLSLEPLSFAPGQDALDEAGRTRLAGVAELMKGRPALRLKLCGKAEPADWPPLAERRRREEAPLLSKLQQLIGYQPKAEAQAPDRDALSELAGGRTAAAKRFLADQAGIDPGRLYECRPEIGTGAKPPRVELLL